MRWLVPSWQGLAALLLCIAAAVLSPIIAAEAGETIAPTATTAMLLLAAIAVLSFLRLPRMVSVLLLFVGAHGAAWLLIGAIAGHEGNGRPAYFLLVAAAWLLAWRCVSELSALRPASRMASRLLALLIPAIFGVWILIIWETVTRGAGIPFIILPPPSAIAARFANSIPILVDDVQQTIFKSVLAGYAIGCSAGFATAILADRVDFLRRGLLPIGNMVSALPIIGVAPIMVMWFGFDWHSKAAVVVVMTFFPMLVNTLAGLAASGHMERDLMRSYGAGYWRTLFSLRIPVALPFLFNALKINSTLALIGAIVAEFFGSPVSGLGFRISTEAARLNMGLVWAAIVVAAVAGSLLYAALEWIERRSTFWHPSIRMG